MKYPVLFKKSFRTTLTVVVIFSILLALFNALSLAEVAPFYSRNTFIEVTTIVISALIALFLVLVAFCSNYIFSENSLKITIAFFPVYKILYSEITNIREYKKTNSLVIGFLNQKNNIPRAVSILVEKGLFDSFAEELRRKNKDIIFDINNDA